MRKIQYLEEQENKLVKQNEAFKAGSSASVVEKMYRILSRKVGKEFKLSTYPTEYSNKAGKFLGYYAMLGSNTLVRINFLLGKSDNVFSLDIFTKNTSRPDKTIYLKGFNIVQIIDQIADVFTGEFDHYNESVSQEDERLEEAIHHSELVTIWVEMEENSSLLENIDKQRANIEDEFARFSRFCTVEHGRKPPKKSSAYLFLISKYVEFKHLSYRIPAIEVLTGLKEDPINTDSTAETAFSELIENEHLLKFRVLEYYVNQVAIGNPAYMGVYIYGDGGVGKSYLAKKYLEPLPQTVYMTGRMKGYTGLMKFLYDNKDDAIIVLDDVLTNEELKNAGIVTLLKNALDPEPPRRIQLQTAYESKIVGNRDGVIVYLTEEEMKDYQKLYENNEVIDMTSSEGMSSINDFTFNSKMLFLTNYSKIPQALQDRCWALQMIFSNDQIMDIIDINIEKIAPNNVPEAKELFNIMGINQITVEDKKDVSEFMRTRNSSGLTKRKYSARVYRRLLALYSATKHTPMWKQILMLELKS